MTQDLNRVFSDMLLQQANAPIQIHDFRSEAKLFEFLHPQVLRGMASFLHDPAFTASGFEWNGWNLHAFATVEEARLSFPKLPVHRGSPYLFKLWMDSPHELMFDFDSLGVAVMSQQPANIEVSLPRATLVPWLTYATSPELWGPQGKWTRFHSRLQTVFEKYGLVNGINHPGYYLLSTAAKKLEAHQFVGDELESAVQWILPWTFPLSGLEKLETLMSQEF